MGGDVRVADRGEGRPASRPRAPASSPCASALATYGKLARAAIDEADKLGDEDTADIFAEISRGTDKWLWFLEAHLQSNR